MKLLLDTHALIWLLDSPELLSSKFRKSIETKAVKELYVSAISMWEIFKLHEKKRLKFSIPIEEWMDTALSHPHLHFVDLTPEILIKSCRLPENFHADPADQMIVATARALDAVVVTKDKKISDYRFVSSTW